MDGVQIVGQHNMDELGYIGRIKVSDDIATDRLGGFLNTSADLIGSQSRRQAVDERIGLYFGGQEFLAEPVVLYNLHNPFDDTVAIVGDDGGMGNEFQSQWVTEECHHREPIGQGPNQSRFKGGKKQAPCKTSPKVPGYQRAQEH